MSNHMHLTPRNRPDIARSWSTREVAERWLRVVSTHEQDANNKESPSEEKINPITMDPERVEELRKRLSSISCFMGKLNEYISRRANKEEGITGRFWEGRFKNSRHQRCRSHCSLHGLRGPQPHPRQDGRESRGL